MRKKLTIISALAAVGFGAWFGVIAVMLYLAVAWPVFQWRNPKANEMSFYRDFKAVVTWQKMEYYQ